MSRMSRYLAVTAVGIALLLILGGCSVGMAPVPAEQELADVTGVWKGDWSGPDAEGTALLDLKQNGTKVTGILGLLAPFSVEIKGPKKYTERRIKKGKLKGQILTFEVPVGTQPITGRFVISGSSMRGTLEHIPGFLDPRRYYGKAFLRRE